jgi:large subunit ribosomal protein L25
METTLTAVKREGRGTNEARRLRRRGQVPGVVYGRDDRQSVPIAVDPRALSRILQSDSGMNTLITLQLDKDVPARVLIKACQVDPIRSALLHVDFYRVAMDRAVTVTVPIVLKGEPAGVQQQGGLLDFVHRDVQIECLPGEIPEQVQADVSELMIGQAIRLRDLLVGVTWTPVSDPEMLIAHVIAPKAEEEVAAAPAEVAAPEAAQPEVIKKGKAETTEEPGQ